MNTALLGLYFAILGILAVYGLHRYLLLYLYYRDGGRRARRRPLDQGNLPGVTVQLPVFNERFVVERLIDAACALDYPRDRLQIQVLDDSTDSTSRIARRMVRQFKRQGWNISLLHRANRQGFKAGALQEGMRSVTGEFVAIFDADFIPSPDFLRKLLPYFISDQVGMVQARWEHLNAHYSWLTRVQAFLLDGHFVIEHTARHRSGRFFNFNGTAGIWRRKTIDDAGGWQSDTLAEDMDISYRAQMKGWKFVYVPEVNAPAEIPSDIYSFKMQQHRWTKGCTQAGIKLLPQILKSDLPLYIKTEAFFHLTNNLAYPCLVLLSVLLFPAVMIRIHEPNQILFIDLPIFLAGTTSLSCFYVLSQRELGKSFGETVRTMPLLIPVGIGMAVNNAKGVMEALLRRPTIFRRTPKFGISQISESVRRGAYRCIEGGTFWIELVLGIYYAAMMGYCLEMRFYVLLPFVAVFMVGFLTISGITLYQRITAG